MTGWKAGEGLVWFSYYDSMKATDLTENPQAAATFWWDKIQK
jgi:pyridoxine/pyridoxamine 5'-phosphate oxidase